jgi:hypothetical protein
MACGNAITKSDGEQISATARATPRGLPRALRANATPIAPPPPERLMALHAPDGARPIDYDAAHAAATAPGGTIDTARFGALIEAEWREQYAGAQHAQGKGVAFTRIEQGSFTYVFDHHSGRPVGVYGTVSPPDGPRDAGAHARLPKAADPRFEKSEKGHLMAHSLGGATALYNNFDQSFAVNRGKGSTWWALEQKLAQRPGTFVATRLSYQDADERRPATVELVVVDGDSVDVSFFSNAPAFFAPPKP